MRKAWGMTWSLDILCEGEREERLERLPLMVFHPSPKFPCLGISSSRTWSVLMSLLQTMTENILWDHGLGAEAGIGFFMCICRWPCTGSWLPYFTIMQTLNLHQTYSSGIFSIPSFLGYVLHLFSAVKIYVSRCIPPLHPTSFTCSYL